MVVDPKSSPTHRRGRRPAGLDSELTFGRASRHDRRAVVVAVERLTGTGTVRICFEITDDQPFAFSPGEWIALEEQVSGVGLRRSLYCIFSPPSEDRRFDLLLRVLPDGPLSVHLATLGRGEEIHFRGPLGRSMLPRSDDDLVLLATGVGISPFYSLCHHLASQGDRRLIRLYWGLRLTDDICLVDELNDVAVRQPNFSYQISLSEPPAQWRQLRGRVTESVPPLLERLGGQHFYLCGNGVMIEEMALALSSLGVDRFFIHKEAFFNIRYRPDPATVHTIVTRFVADDLLSPGSNLLPRVLPSFGPVNG